MARSSARYEALRKTERSKQCLGMASRMSW